MLRVGHCAGWQQSGEDVLRHERQQPVMEQREELEQLDPGPHYRVLIGDTDGVRSGTPEEAASCMQRGAAAASNGLASEQMVWIDIVRPTEDDASMLRDTLGFHPLAVE